MYRRHVSAGLYTPSGQTTLSKSHLGPILSFQSRLLFIMRLVYGKANSMSHKLSFLPKMVELHAVPFNLYSVRGNNFLSYTNNTGHCHYILF